MQKLDAYKAFFEANKHGWDLRTEAHSKSDFYNVEGWKKNPNCLNLVEMAEVGDVNGKSLLHLQCHFGMDTLSWAHLGAAVTGCDLSEKAIHLARNLSAETGIPGDFIACNVYDLPDHLEKQFDIVFTSYGTIGWLPELKPWAENIAHFLKKGGIFYMIDFHPIVWMFDDNFTKITYAYHKTAPIVTEMSGTYADRQADLHYTEYGWNHSLSEILNALIGAGLTIEFLNEHNYSPYNCFSNTVKGEDGNYRIQGLENIIPMMYSIKATRRPD